MLDPRVLAVAATGLLTPDVVARLAGLSEAELHHHHGAEIEAAQRACRRQALTAILMARPSPEALQTVLEADDADGRPGERRLLRGHAVLKLAGRTAAMSRPARCCSRSMTTLGRPPPMPPDSASATRAATGSPITTAS
jgi:hypothetical protein